ncbi:MAG: ChaN family lipoprotein, partial [Vicinamibacterales bacterium]
TVLLAQAAVAAEPPAVYVPERVYDTRRNTFIDFEVMLAELVRADVVLVGEQHHDPNTHRLELALLGGLRRRRVPLTISFEMFERDVQRLVDQYLGGYLDEAQFLRDARPWPRYATDYRSLVELAKTYGWPVIASNVPRRLASEVAKSGLAALDALSSDDRALAARELLCPQDTYFERFAKAMGTHANPDEKKSEVKKPEPDKPETGKPSDGGVGTDPAMTERFYWAQCVKDETMAESIARAFAARPGRNGAVVHFNGAFHSDFGLGAAERTRRRLPGRRVDVVSILPIVDLDALVPSAEDLKRAEFLVYTIKSGQAPPSR